MKKVLLFSIWCLVTLILGISLLGIPALILMGDDGWFELPYELIIKDDVEPKP